MYYSKGRKHVQFVIQMLFPKLFHKHDLAT